MERDLEGKVAVISGGSRGIGRAIARRWLSTEPTAVIAARNESTLSSAAQELVRESGRRIEISPADLGTEAKPRRQGCRGAINRARTGKSAGPY